MTASKASNDILL